MAQFEVTAPNGKTYVIEGNGTKEQALEHFKANWKPEGETPTNKPIEQPVETPVEKPKSAFESFIEGLKNPVVVPNRSNLAGGALGGLVGETAKNIGAVGQLLPGNTGIADKLVKGGEALVEGANKVNPIGTAVGQMGSYVAPVSAIEGTIAKVAPKFAQSTSLLPQMLRSGGVGGATALLTTPGELKERTTPALINAGIGGALPIVPKVASGVKNLMSEALGFTTGSGAESIKQAALAGQKGGETGKSFIENLRGKVPIKDVLADAQSNLSVMKDKLSNQYRSGMVDISNDKSILDLKPVNNLIDNLKKSNIKVGETIDETAHKSIMDVQKLVNKWAKKDPAEALTPEGLDALKQKIYNDVLSKLDPVKESNARRLVGEIYHGVKNTISEQAPTYSKVMKDYSEGADILNEMRGTLGLNAKTTDYTKLNRLQSIMRNNVNTNYGYRKELVDQMIKEGGKDILPALAGQQLNAVMPRGLTGKGIDVVALANALHNPIGSALEISATSPRLVGEVAYKAGQLSRPLARAEFGSPTQQNLAKLLLLKQTAQENK